MAFPACCCQAGTKHWMAPEMWTSSTYDEKVDVFSYAMVIYEIICREVPFEQEELSNLRVNHGSNSVLKPYALFGM